MFTKAQIKYIQSLQHKKYRQKFNCFVAEGDKIVSELLLQKKLPVKFIYALPEWIASRKALLANHPGATAEEINETQLKQISSLITPHQVLAIIEMPKIITPPILENKISLALETIQDPGNLGTILRIADWFGIPYIFCSPGCADAFHSKTVQASMGSIARVQVMEADLLQLLQRNKNISAYAATLHGKNIAEMQAIREGILLIGNESKGLSEKLIQQAHHQITIPRIGSAESLNAAVAAGIICSRLLM